MTTANTLSSRAPAAVATVVALAGAVALQAPFAQARGPAGAEAGFADLIEQVQPSVVTIEVDKLAGPSLSVFGDPGASRFLYRFFGDGARSLPTPQPQRGAGSGFIVDDDGYIVTNHHVIEGAERVTVRLNDAREFSAEVIGTDDKTDLALLKIDADDLVATELGDSDASRVGDWVVAIGNPFGLGGTATVGIVSARGRDLRSGPYDDYLQIDAPINRGNSGGPVFNTEGEVVGVNTAIFSPNGGSVGIGFAIPVNLVT
ncbi:MAG: trypsin-like peptidase domain-containing protein, partial [Pseudomonadota bacterium]